MHVFLGTLDLNPTPVPLPVWRGRQPLSASLYLPLCKDALVAASHLAWPAGACNRGFGAAVKDAWLIVQMWGSVSGGGGSGEGAGAHA